MPQEVSISYNVFVRFIASSAKIMESYKGIMSIGPRLIVSEVELWPWITRSLYFSKIRETMGYSSLNLPTVLGNIFLKDLSIL
jgi:hypothetical protein